MEGQGDDLHEHFEGEVEREAAGALGGSSTRSVAGGRPPWKRHWKLPPKVSDRPKDKIVIVPASDK